MVLICINYKLGSVELGQPDMLPLKISNRLNLGRSVAAAAPAHHANCLAWVIVQPIANPEQSIVEWHQPGIEPLIRPRIIGENPIAHYILRYVEIPLLSYERCMDYPMDSDYYMVIATYQRILALHEQEITDTLEHWHVDCETLSIPSKVEFPDFGFYDNVLEEHSLTRQLITVLRTFPEHTLFSFHFVRPIIVFRSQDAEMSSPSAVLTRKRYAGRIEDIRYSEIIFKPHQKLKKPARDEIPIRNMTGYLDPSSIKYRDGSSWIPIPIHLDPKLADLTCLDCYNPITHQWSSYDALRLPGES